MSHPTFVNSSLFTSKHFFTFIFMQKQLYVQIKLFSLRSLNLEEKMSRHELQRNTTITRM